ncbi:hypothetical protein EFL77_09325 [Pediococcus pentosaceus]|uniref:hypothetical protein n=1 Tax=Pediococcus pentosaceus TaxID=1255 RepID=UPI00223A8800|nr:hypothetical protein [Pediococcus pentosaceus]MCT1178693.1 hypothetical protein [Pediococcus pentosaceus]
MLNDIETLVFVSEMYGAQKYVMYSSKTKYAIVGNIQATRVSPINRKKATLSNVNQTISTLSKTGFIIVEDIIGTSDLTLLKKALKEYAKIDSFFNFYKYI